jgi:hypothetical protein
VIGLNLAVYVVYRRALRVYMRDIGVLPNVALPSSYHEKMFWRRVFDRNPAFVTFCDKLASKEVFASCGEDVAVAETLWVGTDPPGLPAALRRDDVVVKMNAASGRNWVFGRPPDKEADFSSTCRAWLRQPYSPWKGEWGYTQVKPRLFAERMVAPAENRFVEFTVHVFGGEVFHTVVFLGLKRPGTLCAIFDEAGRRLAVRYLYPIGNPHRALPEDFLLPDGYATAMRVARAVARDSDYLRVDFMYAGERLYGCEITPYPLAGLMIYSDPEVMAEMGRLWDLRRAWFLTTPQTGWRRWYQRLLRAFAEPADSGSRSE